MKNIFASKRSLKSTFSAVHNVCVDVVYIFPPLCMQSINFLSDLKTLEAPGKQFKNIP